MSDRDGDWGCGVGVERGDEGGGGGGKGGGDGGGEDFLARTLSLNCCQSSATFQMFTSLI